MFSPLAWHGVFLDSKENVTYAEDTEFKSSYRPGLPYPTRPHCLSVPSRAPTWPPTGEWDPNFSIDSRKQTFYSLAANPFFLLIGS